MANNMEEGVQAASQCSSSFWLSMLDPRPLVAPMSWRRVITWAVEGGIGTGLYFLAREFDLVAEFDGTVNSEIISLAVFMYGYEPAMSILHMALAKYPRLENESQDDEPVTKQEIRLDSNQSPVSLGSSPKITSEANQVAVEFSTAPTSPLGAISRKVHLPKISNFQIDLEAQNASPNPQLAIIIACHNSSDVIEQTLRSCLKHVNGAQIFIMDNGKSPEPTDDTKAKALKIDPAINYCYLPEIGNKSIAVFCGSHWAKLNNYNLSLIIDDDVRLPPTYFINDELIDNPKVKGVVYPVLAQASSENVSWFISWLVKQQNLEYEFADLEMAFLDRTNSVIRPHGACSLWKTEILIRVMEQHNTKFSGEDIQMGLILQGLKKDENGSSLLKLDLHNHFKTLVPETYFGTGGNLYQQRVRSWQEAQFKHFWTLNLKPLFTVWPSTFLSILSVKNSQMYNLHSQFMHVLRVPIMIAAADNSSYWYMFAISLAVQEVTGLVFNYGKLPVHLRNDFITVITHPLYKLVDASFGTLAFLRAIFIGIPGLTSSLSISAQIEEQSLAPPGELLPREVGSNSEDAHSLQEESASEDYLASSNHSSQFWGSRVAPVLDDANHRALSTSDSLDLFNSSSLNA